MKKITVYEEKVINIKAKFSLKILFLPCFFVKQFLLLDFLFCVTLHSVFSGLDRFSDKDSFLFNLYNFRTGFIAIRIRHLQF
jgi:hypothetical protein